MNAPKNEITIDKRLLTEKEAVAYVGQGITKGRVWLKEIGARRNFGRHVVYDKVIIDRAIDEMTATESAGV